MKRRVEKPFGLVVHELDCGDERMLLLEWPAAATAPPRALTALPAAERAVLALVVRGESNAAIARLRGTSVRTVANQVASLLRKTGASSRFDLIRRFAGTADA